MKSFWKRLTALVLAGLLTMGTAGLPVGASAAERDAAEADEGQRISASAQTAMFSVLGLAFLCAGGMVALIMAKDRT